MNNKDVIYVDVEDEITNIIDKVNSSKSKVVALVLPKRATVFQSVVNMKLLKKKATEAKKNVILVTSEAGLLPLAGAVGVHVAKSLQAKPEIPPNPNIDEANEGPINLDDELDEPDEEEPIDSSSTIGEFAGATAIASAAGSKAKNDEPENIEFDNDAAADPMGLSAIDKEAKENPKKAKKVKPAKGLNGKSTKVPDFNKFRKILLIGVAALVALIVLWIIGFKVLPKATIVVQTNTSSINSNLNLTLSQSAGSVVVASSTVPAKYQTTTKTISSSPVNTTGTKNVGTYASGTITVSIPSQKCQFSTCTVNQDSIPAGTVFTDPNGNNYKSNSTVNIPGYTCHPGVCNGPSIQPIDVTATTIGPSENVPAETNYTSSGSTGNGNSMSSYAMNGSSMNGGANNNVQVVAQADVTNAQNQLATPPNSNQVEQQLESTLTSQGYQPIKATYVASKPSFVPSTVIGSQANTVTVTETINYSMFGVKKSDLNTLILANVNQQINPANQSILATGVNGATFTQQTAGTATDQVTMQATSTVGPKLNASTIAKHSVGQKSGDIKSNISQTPGVTNVIVKYSPFWVTATPNNIKKITVDIEKANGSQP